MLKQTFIHLPGIGTNKEQLLWEEGVSSWNQLAENAHHFFTGSKLRRISTAIEKSKIAYAKRDLYHFYESLPRNELWRLIPGNEKRVAFIDIETTGLALPPRNKVTTLSVLINGKLHQAHSEIKKRQLVERIEDEADILVTYFGEVFDIPFLRKAYKVPLKKAQVDLCFQMRRHGYTGGLKGVEKQFRDIPKRKSEDIDGFAAVALWDMYESGNRKALETLLVYNGEDTTVLQHLLEHALKLELEKRPYANLKSSTFRSVPKVKGSIDRRVIRELRNRLFSDYTLVFGS